MCVCDIVVVVTAVIVVGYLISQKYDTYDIQPYSISISINITCQIYLGELV